MADLNEGAAQVQLWKRIWDDKAMKIVVLAVMLVVLHVIARNGHASEIAAALPGVIRVDGDLQLTWAQGDKLPMLARITGLGDKVADVEVVPPSLEDIWSHFSRRDGQRTGS